MPARKRRETTRKTRTTFPKPMERHRPCLRMPPQPFPVLLSLPPFPAFLLMPTPLPPLLPLPFPTGRSPFRLPPYPPPPPSSPPPPSAPRHGPAPRCEPFAASGPRLEKTMRVPGGGKWAHVGSDIWQYKDRLDSSWQ